MKEKITFLFFCVSLSLYSQVGINTSNPKQIFHVDGRSSEQTTNPNTGVPSEEQQADDVVITKDGYLGVGTADPKARIEINNRNTNGAIKIVDGTQAAGSVLTSDANGVGTWKPAGVTVVDGYIPSTGTKYEINGSSSYLGTYIELTKGSWVIYIGMLIGNANQANQAYATRFTLSSSIKSNSEQNNFSFNGTSYILTQKSNGDVGFQNYGMYSSGIIRVIVTSESTTLYLWDVLSKNYGNSNAAGNYLFVKDSAEDYIYAIAEN